MSASVTTVAHKSRPLLYSFLLNSNPSVNQRMKIEAFISRLSGPEIGFYVLDLFVMNNREFFEYCYQLFIVYTLLIRLF